MSIKTRSDNTRKHALAGSGPIVDRARQALARVASQFGTVIRTNHTSVTVQSPDGMTVTLSYAPGNFVFSRVYNLTVTAELAADSGLPSSISLSHRGGRGGRFVRGDGSGSDSGSAIVDSLNAALRPHLDHIDVVSARIERTSGRGGRDGRDATAATHTITLTPMGGSYVWVMIPPVFSATAFPPGEPARILNLIRALRDWAAAQQATAQPAR